MRARLSGKRAQRKYRRAAELILALTLISAFFSQLAASAPLDSSKREIRRVLIFNDFSPFASPGVRVMNQAVFDSLEHSRFQIELYSETLEATLFSGEAQQREFREWVFRKYRDRRPDVIIVVGPASLQFMIESHDRFFPDTPVIFCGSTEEMVGQLKPNSHFTGVWGVARPEQTLNIALKLLPSTKHVVVVGGVGAYERKLEAMAKESLRKYENSLDFTYLTDLDMATLLDRLRHLPKDTIVYHTAITEDAAGAKFIDATQSVPMVAAAANAPVFVVDDVDLGGGTVGGDLLSFAVEGQTAATMVSKVLDGENPENIPVANSANVYMFDWRALNRWGLRESDLPPGSVVLNRRPSVWESFKWYILGGSALILAETLLIFGLLYQRARRRRAENELSITYDRLRLAVEAGRAVGWDWEVKSGRTRWFGDLQTTFGISSDVFSGQAEDFRRRVHRDDQDVVRKAIADARQSRKPYSAEFRVIRDDQAARWIAARGRFYYGKNGDPERMLGIAADVTDRKKMEQKVRESQERLGAIITTAMDAIIAVDDEQQIVLFNRAAEKVFRCSATDAIGTSIDRFIPERFRSEHHMHVRRFGEGSVTNRPMGAVREVWGLRENGEEFPIEASLAQVQTDGGKLLTVILRDITERLSAEKAIQESERRFRLVANTAPVMIWMSGTDKLCNYFNQPWLAFTGRSLEAELGDGWTEGIHAEDFDNCLNTYARAFDLRERFEMNYRLRRHDGEYRWVLDIGIPRFNADDSFAGYIGSCIDITDRKLGEEALATMGRKLIEAHEEERTWIGRELHDDICQRLAILAIELDRWDQKLPQSSETHAELQQFRERVLKIGKDVQGLSHRLHSSHLSYLGLAAAAESFCEEFSEQQKVQVDFKHTGIPAGIPKEISLCLFRVLQEALQNAAKHSGVRHFSAELFCISGEIQLRVSDSGVGFDQKSGPSYRGLGLVSMRERVQLVNGEFSIDSQPDRGTTVLARVPLKEQEFRANAA